MTRRRLTPGRSPPEAPAPPTIEGWLFVPSLGFGELPYYRPDPDHPLHPYNAELRRRPRLQSDLESDPALTDFIDRFRDEVRQQVSRYQAAGRLAPTETLLEAKAYLEQLQTEIQGFAMQHGPPDIDPWIQYHFLMGKLIPARILARNLVPIETVQLMIGSDRAILMRFMGASQRERERYAPLIESAQRALGFRKDAGGNRAIPDDPVKNEQARTAAKLAYLGLTNAEISTFLGWPEGTAGDKRVADYLAAGQQLLGEDDEDWPNERPLRRLSNPHRRGLRPPWGRGEGRLEGGSILQEGQ